MIHILQLLCPAHHCFTAVAWDDAHTDLYRATSELGKRSAQVGGRDPACALCGSKDFSLEDGVTAWTTMDEAMPHLIKEMAAQLRTRDRLLAERN